MREIGSIREFSNGNYELVEDNIVPEIEKKSFIVKLNVYTLIATFIGAIFLYVVYPKDIEIDFIVLWVLCAGFIPFIVIHELLHGLAFTIFNGEKWNKLKFGLILKSGVAYCISTVPVKIKASRISLMMPIYAFCLPMMIIGIVIGNFPLILFGWIYMTGSSGDAYYMWKLRNTSNDLYMYEEMPTASGYEMGYCLYKKID